MVTLSAIPQLGRQGQVVQKESLLSNWPVAEAGNKRWEFQEEARILDRAKLRFSSRNKETVHSMEAE